MANRYAIPLTIGSISGDLLPSADDTYDLGSATAAWQDLFLEGDIALTDAGAITCAGDLTISPTGNLLSGERLLLDSAGSPTLSQNAMKIQLSGQGSAFEGIYMANTGGTFIIAVESSGGSSTMGEGTAYASTLGTVGSTQLEFGTANHIRLKMDTSGNLALQQATTISTTSGNLTLNAAGAGVVISDHISIGAGQTPASAVMVRLGNITFDAATAYGILSSINFSLDTNRGVAMSHEQAHVVVTNGYNLTSYFGTRYSAVTKTGGGTIARVDSIKLVAQTIATNNSAITIETGWTAPSASSNIVQTWAEDIATDDARLGIQAEAGGAIYIGNGGLQLGGKALHGTTTGTSVLSIFNGTAPVGTLTNGISLYSTSGELYAIDAAGNTTLNSPHDSDGNWIFRSKNTVTGRVLKVHMEKLMQRLDEMLGGGFIEEFIEEV